MSLENTYTLDGIDMQILKILHSDGRVSLKELAQTINMSAPSVTERVRPLESRGIIRNFSVDVDLSLLGYTIEAVVRIKPRAGHMKQVEKMIVEQPRFISCDRVTGADCYIAKLVLKSINEIDVLLGPFHECAETNTSIVKSSLVRKREPFAK